VIKKFAVPRGTSDILPETITFWEELESKARKICKSYGYREIRTPVYEDINLFKRSLGQTSDVVNKQLLSVGAITNKPTVGAIINRPNSTENADTSLQETSYALRPEGTASVVRSYLENSFDGRENLSKFFYIGPMFRAERPQKGRLRQFHQIGVEAIGPNSTSPFLDAEMMALAIYLLKELGVKNPQLKINSLGSKEDKITISNWLRGEFEKHKDELCEDCQARYERNVFRVLDCKKENCRKLVQGLVKNLPLSAQSQDYFNQVQSALTSVGISFEVSPHLVRGLDYYTHTVFEITAEGLGSQDAVGAGGRYNGLVHELGGNEKVEYGAIGFALGIERILLAKGPGVSVSGGIDAYVIAMDAEYQPKAFVIAQQLRQAGIVADLSFAGGSMKSQMGRANKAQARFALILGEDEIKNQSVSLKDMQLSQQENIPQSKIVDEIKKKLS